MAVAVHNKTSFWLEENEKFFLPPVCNKMMHNDQLKVRETVKKNVYFTVRLTVRVDPPSLTVSVL